MTQDSSKKPHHHGNLKAALIEAGLQILAESGTHGLTLRACAARAGVSHSAPAHHFTGLPGLMTAIAARGFDMFSASMNRARQVADPDPRAQVIAICHGYLDFARDHPALFTLMFNTPTQLDPDAAFHRSADAAYDILAQTCALFRPVTEDPRSTEIMVWSLVHGLACLLQGKRFKPEGGRFDMPSIEDILPHLDLRESDDPAKPG